jgi:hypothetical protein
MAIQSVKDAPPSPLDFFFGALVKVEVYVPPMPITLNIKWSTD